MGLVEEEDELRLVRIADLRQVLENLRDQPQQEGGIELRRGHQLVGGEDVDVTAPVAGGAHEIVNVERRLAEEMFAALFFQNDEAALNGADGRGTDIAVIGGDRFAAGGKVGEQRPEIRQVEQQQPLLIGNPESDVEGAFLRLGQVPMRRDSSNGPISEIVVRMGWPCLPNRSQ